MSQTQGQGFIRDPANTHTHTISLPHTQYTIHTHTHTQSYASSLHEQFVSFKKRSAVLLTPIHTHIHCQTCAQMHSQNEKQALTSHPCLGFKHFVLFSSSWSKVLVGNSAEEKIRGMKKSSIMDTTGGDSSQGKKQTSFHGHGRLK